MTNACVTNVDISLGRPTSNAQIYIVDQYRKLVPISVTGELCIAGDCVGAGYLNRPELTAQKFIDNPFGTGKLYKTGDLAYWREDGNISYVGRNDFQVKIRGLRIELGEIENAISMVEGVSQAVVVVRKDETGRQLICAFYTGKELEAKEIRNEIGKTLPKYMLPHIVTHLDEMPLTASGKTNRKALPEVDLSSIVTQAEYVRPTGKIEKNLAKLMEEVLEYSPVGLLDDFFDLGGDSLKAIEFVSKAHSERIYFELQAVFDNPTVQTLTEHIQKKDKEEVVWRTGDFESYNEILNQNVIGSAPVPKETRIGNVLLTGATGFLGAHILNELLNEECGNVYCLVRGENESESCNRLNSVLRHYFGNKYDGCPKLKVVCGDIEEQFALDAQIDMVIHSAASVKHYGSYKYFYGINVVGTKNMLTFAKEKNARFLYISTISVSGNTFADSFDVYVSEEEKHFYESSLFIGQDLRNVYARSKFEAERAVLDAMKEGLRANICRMGNLTNRASDGVFSQIINQMLLSNA